MGNAGAKRRGGKGSRKHADVDPLCGGYASIDSVVREQNWSVPSHRYSVDRVSRISGETSRTSRCDSNQRSATLIQTQRLNAQRSDSSTQTQDKDGRQKNWHAEHQEHKAETKAKGGRSEGTGDNTYEIGSDKDWNNSRPAFEIAPASEAALRERFMKRDSRQYALVDNERMYANVDNLDHGYERPLVLDNMVEPKGCKSNVYENDNYKDIPVAKPTVKAPSMVIAIDFGTTYTGYAFSLNGSRDEILTAKHGNLLQDDRVPSVILLDENLSFKAFGYKARELVAELSPTERSKCYYIEHFKMGLYSGLHKISRDTVLIDSRNRQISAMHVFTLTLRYFYEMAICMARLAVLNFEEEYAQWILTIPAIWSDSARQFMREAAIRAGIQEDKLRLVLEPEAASLFCRENKIFATADKMTKLPVGHKYMLADLGGGTVDICIHEILTGDHIRELYRATGGDMGGNTVNKAYSEFLKDLFGKDVWERFKERHLNLYFDMMLDFETKKKSFSMGQTDTTTLVMEAQLLTLLKQSKGKSLENKVKTKPYRDSVIVKASEHRLVIRKELMLEFFLPTVDRIIKKLREVLDANTDSHIQTLMLVGGFAESPYLRERIVSEFNDVRVILHHDTRLAVLKGAVMMGYMPRNIIQRRARFTYGISGKVPFIEGVHPASLKIVENGKAVCIGVFKTLIKKGQVLNYGDHFTVQGYNIAVDPEMKHKDRYTVLYRSIHDDPQYCVTAAGEGCVKVGVIVRKAPPGGWQDYWEKELRLIVGETEFKVMYINKTTGEELYTRLNFL